MYQQSREEVFAECEENGEEWARDEAASPTSPGAQHAREWLQMDALARVAEREKHAARMLEFSECYAEKSASMTRWAVWGTWLTAMATLAYLVNDIFLA
jgi:hypothetical protein